MTEPTDEVTPQNALVAIPLDGARQVEAGDRALIAAISVGDSHALEILYDRYAAGVYHLALRMLKSPELAEELVQDTFWRIWRRSVSFECSRGRVAAWLFSIAHNLCVDALRRMRARPAPVYTDVDHPVIQQLVDEQADVPAAAWATERHWVIVEALRQLPRPQRQVIALAYFGAMSQTELASKLGCPLGTIKTRIRLGQQKLSGLLAALGPPSSESW